MLLLRKDGGVSQVNAKSTDMASFYKRAGFKSDTGFTHRHTFMVPQDISSTVVQIRVFAKDAGRAGMENKTELPPPIDIILFYGSILCVGFDADGAVCGLADDLWAKMYDHIFGGFESLDDTAEADDAEEDELDAYPDEMKTKHGYLKDGFVVDSDDDDDNTDGLSFDEYI